MPVGPLRDLIVANAAMNSAQDALDHDPKNASLAAAAQNTSNILVADYEKLLGDSGKLEAVHTELGKTDQVKGDAKSSSVKLTDSNPDHDFAKVPNVTNEKSNVSNRAI